MVHAFDPEGTRLPIKIDATSNGEFAPRPIGAAATAANRLARLRTDEIARRLGLPRRRFLASASGAAATLLALNEAFAAAGRRGGFFAVPADAAYDPPLAEATLGGEEFIFDVQTHHVDPDGAWRSSGSGWNRSLSAFPQAACGEPDAVACFGRDDFLREIFLESDTDMAVLSMVPEAPERNPLSIEAAAASREAVAELRGNHRLLLHAPVHPQLPGSFERMERDAGEIGIAAWKTYTQWGPEGEGFFLDDEEHGIPFIEKGRSLGVPVFCMHKGLPFRGFDDRYSTCRDVGPAARLFPDSTFIVYHSGYVSGAPEGPYDPDRTDGVDALITSLRENGIGPDGNVYAELGSTWRQVMRDPDEAAHLIGKLLRYVGEDRVLWGTDSIWYGSPQDQIQAFRTFQISEDFRERYGYSEITPGIRAKVFGLNAAKPYGIAPTEVRKRAQTDRIGRTRQAWQEAPDPSFMTYGPKTRREFLRLLQCTGGRPT